MRFCCLISRAPKKTAYLMRPSASTAISQTPRKNPSRHLDPHLVATECQLEDQETHWLTDLLVLVLVALPGRWIAFPSSS